MFEAEKSGVPTSRDKSSFSTVSASAFAAAMSSFVMPEGRWAFGPRPSALASAAAAGPAAPGPASARASARASACLPRSPPATPGAAAASAGASGDCCCTTGAIWRLARRPASFASFANASWASLSSSWRIFLSL